MSAPTDKIGVRIGERVGPFQIVEWLRTSGGVSLYRGVRPETSRNPRQVAIRLPEKAGDAATADRLRREYDIMRDMDDPRVPRAYGWYSGQAALAHTWIDGVSLDEVLRAWSHRLVPHDPGSGLDVCIEVAHALRHAHSILRPSGATGAEGDSIVFGNLAPEHVLLCADGRVFLTGFGAEPGTHDNVYAAPERIAGAFQDMRTDQWDLGALIVEVLTGVRVGTHDALPERDGPNNPLNRIGRRWADLSAVLRRMLSPAAGNRYTNESELLRQLMAAGRAVQGHPDRSRLAGQTGEVVHRLRNPRIADGPLEPAQPASLERTAVAPPRPVRPTAPPAPAVTPVEVDFDPDSAPLGRVLAGGPTLTPAAGPADGDSAGGIRASVTPVEIDLDPDSAPLDEPIQVHDDDCPHTDPVEVTYDRASTPGVDPVELDYDPDSKPIAASRAHSVAVNAPDRSPGSDDHTQPAVTVPIVTTRGSEADEHTLTVPLFQWTEILGMAMGVLLIVTGVLFLSVKIYGIW